MADVKKVENSLRHCIPFKCDGCDYHGIPMGCAVQLRIDAFSVIEELQEENKRLQPKKGKWIFTGQKNAYGGTVIQCPFCDDKYAAQNPSDEHFCRNCGAKLMD